MTEMMEDAPLKTVLTALAGLMMVCVAGTTTRPVGMEPVQSSEAGQQAMCWLLSSAQFVPVGQQYPAKPIAEHEPAFDGQFPFARSRIPILFGDCRTCRGDEKGVEAETTAMSAGRSIVDRILCVVYVCCCCIVYSSGGLRSSEGGRTMYG